MPWKYITVGAICLLLGFFVRGTMDDTQSRADGTEPSPSSDSTAGVSRVRDSGSSMSRGRRNGRSGGDKTEDLSVTSGLPRPGEADLVVVPDTLLEHLSRSNKIFSLHNDLFSSGNRIEEVLQISDREKANLQNAWRKTREKLRKLEASNAKSVTLEDGSVQISVPNLGSQISGLGDEFYKDMIDQLGQNRAVAFAASSSLGSAFSNLSGEAVYTVKVEAIGDGRWRYKMSQRGPSGNKVWVGENVPPAIRHLTDVANIRSNLNPSEEEEDQ